MSLTPFSPGACRQDKGLCVDSVFHHQTVKKAQKMYQTAGQIAATDIIRVTSADTKQQQKKQKKKQCTVHYHLNRLRLTNSW